MDILPHFDENDVISLEVPNTPPPKGTRDYKIKGFRQGIKCALENIVSDQRIRDIVNNSLTKYLRSSPLTEWFTGIKCEILRPGYCNEWIKGKLVIKIQLSIEFIPENKER